MMATVSNNVVSERRVTPSAVARPRHDSPMRLQLVATRVRIYVAATILKASPEGEGFNPPSVGQ
ncbi:MAG: hypothetical protein QM820_36275 [Minicystis sp.]